jgi:hypothetical protein
MRGFFFGMSNGCTKSCVSVSLSGSNQYVPILCVKNSPDPKVKLEELWILNLILRSAVNSKTVSSKVSNALLHLRAAKTYFRKKP